MSGDELLRAEGLRRRVGEAVLLHAESLRVRAGDRIALVGPTGSGKTLLLRALAMLDGFDAGQILYRGRVVDDRDVPAYRSRVIYLHQQPWLGDGRVADALAEPFRLKSHEQRRPNRPNLLRRLAALGRDESFLARRCEELSGGESQLVALLRAMGLDPQVLLLDEPTAALDDGAAADVERLVEDWIRDSEADRAVVWVTHDRGQARRIANRRLEIRGGVVRESSASAKGSEIRSESG